MTVRVASGEHVAGQGAREPPGAVKIACRAARGDGRGRPSRIVRHACDACSRPYGKDLRFQ